jgi:hypothetical protein
MKPDRTKYKTEVTASEKPHAVNGVPGRKTNTVRHASTEPNQRLRNQAWISERRAIPKTKEMLQVTIRHDDEFLNGQASFAITGDITERGVCVGGGCCHDLIAAVFPELAELIQWHLFDERGPFGYPGNPIYLAGDRDCWGLRKDERRQIINGKSGKPSWKTEVSASLEKYVDADECPTETATIRYVPWEKIGEGKARELDAARSSANWPEATDEELSTEPEILKARLMERLPAMLARFRNAVESIGFEFA